MFTHKWKYIVVISCRWAKFSHRQIKRVIEYRNRMQKQKRGKQTIDIINLLTFKFRGITKEQKYNRNDTEQINDFLAQKMRKKQTIQEINFLSTFFRSSQCQLCLKIPAFFQSQFIYVGQGRKHFQNLLFFRHCHGNRYSPY